MWKCFIFLPVTILHSHVELHRNTFVYVVRQRLVTQLVLHAHEWHPSGSNVDVRVNTTGVALKREHSKPFVMHGTLVRAPGCRIEYYTVKYLSITTHCIRMSMQRPLGLCGRIECECSACFFRLFCDTQHVPAACVQVDHSPAIVHRKWIANKM